MPGKKNSAFPKFNRTKIIATIGPASMNIKVLEKMAEAGVDVARINASHGDAAMHATIIKNIREINRKKNLHIAILFDLQGPKIRIGDIEGGETLLSEKQKFILSQKKLPGNSQGVYIAWPNLPHDVTKGSVILIDDGRIKLQVKEIRAGGDVLTQVINGGILSSRKGVNLPHIVSSIAALTEKDYKDLDFAIANKVEWIGLSFVRSARDVLFLKELIKKKKSQAKVIAKIEKPEAVKNILSIISAADAIMVARGDLGVEMEMEKVPVVQKKIVALCRQYARPVIIATQMMESMITNFRPTRAEANDVGNAVYDGADALMLSAETAVGNFPSEVILAMQKIITAVEEDDALYYRLNQPDSSSFTFISDSVCYTACLMAMQSRASAIAAMTHSGYTAFKISSQRPRAGIYIFTDNLAVINTLNLVWGVKVFNYAKYVSTDKTITDIKNFLKRKGLIQSSQILINVASTPMNERARANTIKISKV